MIHRFTHYAVVTLCATLALLAPRHLPAQRVCFFLLGGVNSSKAFAELDGEDVDTDRRTGWTAGGYAEFGIGKRVSIRPELLVTEQGGEQSESGETIRVNLRYVQMPVLARVDLAGSESIRIVVAGNRFQMPAARPDDLGPRRHVSVEALRGAGPGAR